MTTLQKLQEKARKDFLATDIAKDYKPFELAFANYLETQIYVAFSAGKEERDEELVGMIETEMQCAIWREKFDAMKYLLALIKKDL